MALRLKELDVLDDLEGFDDFTVASSWERFIARTEAVCREWQNASSSELLASATRVEGVLELHKVHTELPFGSKNYGIDLYFETVDKSGSREDWTAGLHPLQLWFGVTDFVIVSPMSMSGVVLDAPEATLLLSTMAVALSNCGSDWPVFVPVHDPTRKAYQGIKGTFQYETDRMGSRIPVELMHLEGLYDFFASKVAFKTAGFPAFEVEFTMQLTYRTPMPGFEFRDANAEPISNYDGDMLEDLAWDEDCAWAEWHSVEDPVKGFELICSWSTRNLRSSFDAAEYEKTSPSEADKWLLTTIKVKDQEAMQEEESTGFVGRLRALVHAFNVASQAQFIEDFAADVPSIKHVTHNLKVPPPTVLERVLKDLFEEAPSDHERQRHHKYSHGVKAAPPDSLLSRFCLHALRFGTCNIRAISVLWIEFIREVRWYWDEGHRLPRVSVDGSPDLEASLLHQKLQLLTLCIDQKASQQAGLQHEDYSEGSPTAEISAGERILTPDKRKGSAGPIGNLMLLNSSHSLHMPITQKPPLLTEDMLEEREQTLAMLQNSSWGNQAGTRRQRDILASYMAAFKAANPGAVLEDFMHWYSLEHKLDPGDVGEGDIVRCRGADQAVYVGNGSVLKPQSDKFQIWDSVDACAATDQKPLFDYTREAEKVIHYLDTIRPEQLLAQMLVCSFAVAAHTLDCSVTNFRVPTLTWELEELSTSMASVFQLLLEFVKIEKPTPDQAAHWQETLLQLCSVFERVEGNIILAVSLGKKLGNAPRLLAGLINHHLERHEVPFARVLVEKGLTSNRWKEMEYSDEREVVTNLFSHLTPSEDWISSSSLGHFLNGHEPLSRELIMWRPIKAADLLHNFSNIHRSKKREAQQGPAHPYSHRMYVHGTLNDIQVAYVAMAAD